MCLRFCVINVSDCVLISSLLKGSILEALEGRKYDRMLCLLGVVNDLLYNGELVKGVWGYRKGICEWLEEVRIIFIYIYVMCFEGKHAGRTVRVFLLMLIRVTLRFSERSDLG